MPYNPPFGKNGELGAVTQGKEREQMGLQIGYVTQIGAILLVVGLCCLLKPYDTAKWHANDAEIEKRLFKRQQSHKKKSERQEYHRDPNRVDVEPSAFSMNVFRVLGALSTAVGVVCIVWSLV